MAGINLGPFPEYRSRWISGSAGELFDFSNPDSKVSQDYMAALEVVLRFGARIVYAGSIDDQLVSLEVRFEESLLSVLDSTIAHHTLVLYLWTCVPPPYISSRFC
jgi:hypothetical protein